MGDLHGFGQSASSLITGHQFLLDTMALTGKGSSFCSSDRAFSDTEEQRKIQVAAMIHLKTEKISELQHGYHDFSGSLGGERYGTLSVEGGETVMRKETGIESLGSESSKPTI